MMFAAQSASYHNKNWKTILIIKEETSEPKCSCYLLGRLELDFSKLVASFFEVDARHDRQVYHPPYLHRMLPGDHLRLRRRRRRFLPLLQPHVPNARSSHSSRSIRVNEGNETFSNYFRWKPIDLSMHSASDSTGRLAGGRPEEVDNCGAALSAGEVNLVGAGEGSSNAIRYEEQTLCDLSALVWFDAQITSFRIGVVGGVNFNFFLVSD